MILSTTGRLNLELTPTSYTEMMVDVTELVRIMVTEELQNIMMDKVLPKMMERLDMGDLLSHVSNNINYNLLADYVRREFVPYLLNDERFNTRVMRHIGNATIGVTNEAVERVTAIIKSNTTTQGDF